MNSKWEDSGKVLALKSDIVSIIENNAGSDAPSTPAEGEAWYDSTNNFIRWYDGSNWNCIAVFIGSAAPGTPVEGNVWFDTTNHFLKCYDGSNWVCFGTFVGSAAPGTPLEGLVWYDSTNDICKAYDGSAWSSLMVYVAAAFAGTPAEGNVWYDTANNRLLAYDGSGWNGEGMVYANNSAPSNPFDGQIWYDLDDDELKSYNGSGWDVHPSAGNVGRTELNTDTEEETTDVPTATWTLYTFSNPGGYGFNTQVAFEASTDDAEAQIYYESTGNETYQDTVAVYHASGDNRNCYAKMRYVVACSEVCWIFILKDKATGKYVRVHKCPDHPCISVQNVDKRHHPFDHCYDKEKHEILCIPLTKEERQEIEDLREWEDELPKLEFLTTMEKYFDIDENPKDAKWPDIPVTIGVDRNKKEMKAKIPKRKYIKQAKLIRKS